MFGFCRHAQQTSAVVLGLAFAALAILPLTGYAFPKTTELNYATKGPLVSWANQILAKEIKDVKAIKSDSFGVSVAEYDLNADGIKERIVAISDGMYYGVTGGYNHVFQNRGGKWVDIYQDTCSSISIFPTKHKGYADIMLGVPGKDIPVLHWDGKHYIFHHNENGFS